MNIIWNKFKNRTKFPRKWLYPEVQRKSSLTDEEWRRQENETSRTIRRVMAYLIGFSLFTLITLSTPDVYLFSGSEGIRIPFAGSQISFKAFLFLAPLMLIGLIVYLHLFIGYNLLLGIREEAERLPFLFNMSNPIAIGLSWIIFYLLPLLVMFAIYWKAQPLGGANWLLIVSLVVTCVLIFLQIRRCQNEKRKKIVPILWIVFGFCFLGILITPLYYNIVFNPAGYLYRRLNLESAVLSGNRLNSVKLAKADLRRANLEKTDLREADLFQANLSGASLKKANLLLARLHQAKLTQADLKGAILTEADLSDADLSDANLSQADLRLASLKGAILTGADLSDANLSDAKLSQADLRFADLKGAILTRANLNQADLGKAILTETDLKGARLDGANLYGADLRGAKAIDADRLCEAKTLLNAILDPELEKQIEEKCNERISGYKL